MFKRASRAHDVSEKTTLIPLQNQTTLGLCIRVRGGQKISKELPVLKKRIDGVS
jgi:hypothetical protein